ncbi:MAG: VanW family protein [Coriobacteriia bacterium]|nr:VanW family protein [Coriobacteriia bacterium]
MTIKLTEQELLKSVLYEDRHADANAEYDQSLELARGSNLKQEESQQLAEKRRQRKKRLMQFGIPVAVVVIVLAGLITYDYIASWGKIHQNVIASGIEIGGKTPLDAAEYLGLRLENYAAQPVQVSYSAADAPKAQGVQQEVQNSQWYLLADEIGLSFDTTAAVEAAYHFGRDDNILISIRDRFLSYFEAHQLDLKPIVDEEIAVERFEPLRQAINVVPVDSKVLLQNGQFVIESGSDGICLDETELVVLMAYAILAQDLTITAPAQIDYRDIGDEAAQRAARSANRAITLPVDVRYNDKSWNFDTEDIIALIAFARSDELEADSAILLSGEASPTTEVWLEAYIAVEPVTERIVSRLGAEVGRPPVDARFSVSGGQVIIHPSENGSGVDSEQLARDLAAALVDQNVAARSVAVTMRDIEPALTTEGAQAMGIREQISTFTIPFPAGNSGRTHNIQLISRILNGTIVAPGEVFSFNQTTGQRTAADGFREAGVIVGGEMSTAVGGGICQVSSTLFNTALLAGVQITNRVSHSSLISQYPLGRDAAVARGGPDFAFKNTLDNHILIVSSATGSAATVSFYGVKPGYTINISTGEFRRNSYSTSEVRDNTLPEGTRVVETRGVRGGTVNVYYTVRRGETVVRQQTFTSWYRTTNEIVRIGTRPAPAAPSPAPPPPPTGPE